MTGRKSTRKRTVAKQPQQQQQQLPAQKHIPQPVHQVEDSSASNVSSPPSPNIRKEQPPPQQVVKKILKAENEEASTLKTVFKSNPDAQMRDFIKKASSKPQTAPKVLPKTPAEAHPPAVAQELLETDDDVADNLAKLFKASKSYKNV